MQFNKNDQRFDLLGVVTALLLVVAVALLAFVLVPQMVSQDMSAGLINALEGIYRTGRAGAVSIATQKKETPPEISERGFPLRQPEEVGASAKPDLDFSAAQPLPAC